MRLATLKLQAPAPALALPAKAAVGLGDAADTGPGEVETVGAFVGVGEFGKEFLARVHRLRRFVIIGDAPRRIGEHQGVVVRDIHEMQERVAA